MANLDIFCLRSLLMMLLSFKFQCGKYGNKCATGKQNMTFPVENEFA